jgi:hypothetical protein
MINLSRNIIKRFYSFLFKTLDQLAKALIETFESHKETVIGFTLIGTAYGFFATSPSFKSDASTQIFILYSGCGILTVGLACCLLAAWRTGSYSRTLQKVCKHEGECPCLLVQTLIRT